MATTRVPVVADTLVWARERLGFTAVEVATSASVKPELYAKMETGEGSPTLVQLRKIAHKLDRPIAFFLAPPPEASDVPETVDFRSRGEGPLPPGLLRELKRAESHRATFLELVGLAHEHARPGQITRTNVGARARQFREALGLLESFVPSERQAADVFNFGVRNSSPRAT